MFVQPIKLSKINQRIFSYLVSQIKIQKKIILDKITAVFGLNLFLCLLDSVIQNYRYYRSSGLETTSQLNKHTKLLTTKHVKHLFLTRI